MYSKFLNMKRILFILTIGMLLTACSKDDENLLARYDGTWSGTYTGDDDNGTWSVIIDEEGIATGVATSTTFGESFPVNGVVAPNGEIDLTTGTTTPGGTFTGVLDPVQGTGSGTWINHLTSPPMTGTWSGTKQ